MTAESRSASSAKVIVVGAGIGGLAAGIALDRAGREVEIFERVSELREIGAGISLWTNALTVLDVLGLGEATRAAGMPGVHAGLRTWRGDVLTGVHMVQGSPLGVCVMHRADLQTVLLQAFGRSRVHRGAQLERVAEDAGGVVARFRDGREVRADALVGADGLHSVVRAQLHGDTKPRYAGYTAWRAVVRFDARHLAPGESLGQGVRFGHLPMNDGRVYWFGVSNAPEGAKSPEGEKAELLRLFRGWHAPIEALIAATPESDILRNDIYDRPPLRNWGRGRVTLLGDAAHPMTPNLGQGACQALEDAIVLASCLAHRRHDPADQPGAGVARALRRYEAVRIPRTHAIVQQSRQLGRMWQWQHPRVTQLRNAVIKHLGPYLQGPALSRLLTFTPPPL